MSILNLYKIVVKDSNGKVIQIHERYRVNVAELVLGECDAGNRVTVTQIQKGVIMLSVYRIMVRNRRKQKRNRLSTTAYLNLMAHANPPIKYPAYFFGR